ncbi:MAG TPA: MXAN_5187 C-terminal domain-containing protein [Candidatus Polarisedimenticolaceae bacterium]|nr:MXAN_5187 C-terminal domain-containing protein [Candidatus Polarisedimenticolaceae bacterium]
MQDQLGDELDADIVRLEAAIRQLKIQYDMFFAGSVPKQPHELRAEVERIIKRYANAPIKRYASRFHFNTLVSRFGSLSELWSKTIRSLEEGDRPAPAVADRAGAAEQVVARCTVADSAENGALRLLHQRLLEARKKSGEPTGKLTFDSFLKSVAAQAGRLRDKTGCAKVELRVIVQDRKVTVKARPGR